MVDNHLMLRLAVVAALLAPWAQAQQMDDPANLMGERVSPQSLADTLPINHGAAALQQLLLKLRTRASVMLIVAHPDDEDGGFLTYESRGVGARVAMLTLTRGEGGQNLMSADFDDALGLIRTQELLAADRYMGVDQFFGTEVDFGFSKTKEESFQKWTHERVLYDAVRCVRLYRPLVIASVFVGGVTDGHGQHQVSGEIAQEVFVAAADPKVFPEMGLPPWAPLKVYARVPFSRVTNKGMFDYATGKYAPPLFHNYITGVDLKEEPKATVTIHEGAKSTMLGMEGDSWVQFARKGLALQKTQIGNNTRLAPAGVFDVGYTLMGSRVSALHAGQEETIFDGVDVSLPVLAPAGSPLRAQLASIDRQVAEAQRLFDPVRLELTVPPLREALKSLDALLLTAANDNFSLLHELRIKRVQLNDALVLAHGITAEAMLSNQAPGRQVLTTQKRLSVSASVTSKNAAPIPIAGFHLLLPDSSSALVRPAASGPTVLAADLSRVYPETRPYFSRRGIEQPFYDVADRNLRNAPSTPAPIVSEAEFNEDGVRLQLLAEVADLSQPAGFAKQAAIFVPPVSVSLSPTAGMLRLNEQALTLSVSSYSCTPQAAAPKRAGTRLETPAGWRQTPSSFVDARGDYVRNFFVTPGDIKPNESYRFTAVCSFDGQDYTEAVRSAGYPGLTYTNFYTPASSRFVGVDVKTARVQVAYLAGTGDSVPESLNSLGVAIARLNIADLTPEKLKRFDAVVLGVRAYAAHPELAGKGSQPLLEYARGGGVVVVQYTTSQYGTAEAPYAIEVPGDPAHNVVVEAQPLSILKPDAPLLSWPNKIGAADFRNWVAEYGHGFAASWAPEYQPLLEVHDPDQDPQKGGLLVAPVGKGAYIYCALALYRQLPEGVPGAYRLFANLLSYGKNPLR